jgi:hypothetical protein
MFYFQSGQFGHSTNTIILKSNEHKSYAWVFCVICTFQSSGGACVLSVIRFQEDDQLWSVPKLENDIPRQNASTNGRKTDLIERYILDSVRIRS